MAHAAPITVELEEARGAQHLRQLRRCQAEAAHLVEVVDQRDVNEAEVVADRRQELVGRQVLIREVVLHLQERCRLPVAVVATVMRCSSSAFPFPLPSGQLGGCALAPPLAPLPSPFAAAAQQRRVRLR